MSIETLIWATAPVIVVVVTSLIACMIFGKLRRWTGAALISGLSGLAFAPRCLGSDTHHTTEL